MGKWFESPAHFNRCHDKVSDIDKLTKEFGMFLFGGKMVIHTGLNAGIRQLSCKLNRYRPIMIFSMSLDLLIIILIGAIMTMKFGLIAQW